MGRLHVIADEEAAVKDFAEILVHEATTINSNVVDQAIRTAIDKSGLSWAVIEDQRKEIIVARLREIVNLDEVQCVKLFHELDQMIPIEGNIKRWECFVEMIWITKCMYSVLE